jgi:kynurenine 3-monooxygenase
VGADFKNKVAWFDSKGNTAQQEIEVKFDLLIGADGAHSAVRYHLMKYTRMDYQQEYIDTLWCEFQIQPNDKDDKSSPNGRFQISENHLHIWPGKEFMFIAIPSLVSYSSISLASLANPM